MNWKKPEMNAPKCKELNERQLKSINGGNVGTCCGVGYTCGLSKGGFKMGTCLFVGYSCTFTKGSW